MAKLSNAKIMNITEFKAILKRKIALTRKELSELNVECKEHGNKATVIINNKMIDVDICQDTNIREKVAEAGSRLRLEQIGNKNAYIYHCQNGRVYVSYNTPIAVYLDNTRLPSIRRDYKDFSNTTTRHVSVFKEIMGYTDVQYVRGA